MDTSRDHSVGEILDQLLSDELIDACHITGDQVTIVQGTKRHTFPYQHARTFLMGMLRGRSWNLNPRGEHAVSPLRPVEKQRETIAARVDGGHGVVTPSFIRSLEPSLNELLEISRDLELIEGYEKDPDAREVTVILSACQTTMNFEEAVTFLAECVLYKLKRIREDVDVAPQRTPPENESAKARIPQPVWQRLA